MKFIKSRFLMVTLIVLFLFNNLPNVQGEETSQHTDYEIAQLIKPAFKYDEEKTFAVEDLRETFAEIMDLASGHQKGWPSKDNLEAILPEEPTKLSDSEDGGAVNTFVAVDRANSLVLSVHYDDESKVRLISWVNHTQEIFQALDVTHQELRTLVGENNLQVFLEKFGEAENIEIQFSEESAPKFTYRWYNANSKGPEVGEIVAVEVQLVENEIVEYGFTEKE